MRRARLVITCSTSRPNGSIPVVGSVRPTKLGSVDVVGGQVGQRPASVVLVLDPHHPGFARRQRRVAAAAGLDGSLLVRADHILPPAQPTPLEGPGVEVQHHRCFHCEVRVPREDPRPVKPRFDGIRSQRPPNRRRRDERHHSTQDQFPGQLGASSNATAARRWWPAARTPTL